MNLTESILDCTIGFSGRLNLFNLSEPSVWLQLTIKKEKIRSGSIYLIEFKEIKLSATYNFTQKN